MKNDEKRAFLAIGALFGPVGLQLELPKDLVVGIPMEILRVSDHAVAVEDESPLRLERHTTAPGAAAMSDIHA